MTKNIFSHVVSLPATFCVTQGLDNGVGRASGIKRIEYNLVQIKIL